MVSVGFAAAPLVITLPSDTNRLGTSCARPNSFTTPSSGRALMRAVPRLCEAGYGGTRNVAVASDGTVNRLAGGVAVLAHRHIVRVLVDMHVGNRLAELVVHIAVQRDPVALPWQVLADQQHAGHVVVPLHDLGEAAAPGARAEEVGQEGRAEGVQLHVVAADEAAPGVIARLVGHDARHRLTAVHPHWLVERGEHRPGHVPHVIAPYLAAGVRQPVRKERGSGVQQEPRGLDRVAGDADGARPLALLASPGVDVDDAGHLA